MPAEVFRILVHTRIRNRQLKISRLGSANRGPRHGSKGKFNRGPKKSHAGHKGHKGGKGKAFKGVKGKKGKFRSN